LEISKQKPISDFNAYIPLDRILKLSLHSLILSKRKCFTVFQELSAAASLAGQKNRRNL